MSVGRTKVSVSDSDTLIVAANRGRASLTIINDSDTDIFISEGSTAVINEGIRLNAGGGVYDERRRGVRQRLFTGQIRGISGGAAGKNVTVMELDEGER